MTGKRKFLITLVAILPAFLLALFGKLNGDYVTIVTFSVGAFSAANAFEHKTNNGK
jgi:hypothetical protein